MENSKIFTIFAGINGAGKTTLYNTLAQQNFGIRLNTDEYLRDAGMDWRDYKNQMVASRKILSKQKECLEKGLSFNRETTFSGFGIVKTIIEAKKLGYIVNLYFIGVDSLEKAKMRVEKRYLMGGHSVPEDIMDLRFDGIPKALYNALPHCDNIKFYDNSQDGIELIAYKMDKEFEIVKEDCGWLTELFNNIEKIKEEDELNHNQIYYQIRNL